MSLGYALLAPPALVLPVSTAFFFDAPGSDNIRLTWILAGSVAIVPLVLLIAAAGGAICSFGNNSKGKRVVGWVFAYLPVINLVAIIIAFRLLDALCGGRFDCRH